MKITNMKGYTNETGLSDNGIPEYRAIIKCDNKDDAIKLIDRYKENTDIKVIRFLKSFNREHNLIYISNNKDFDFIVGY